MSYFEERSARETKEAIEGIQEQLRINNLLMVLKESYELGEIDRETYVQNLNEAYNVLRN